VKVIWFPSENLLLVKNDDGAVYADADIIMLTNNAMIHLFNNIKYQLSGQKIESLFHPGQATTMLGLLKFPDYFQKSTRLNQLWFKDTVATAHLQNNTGFGVRKQYIIQKPDPNGTFSFRIPLKHIFGFCDDYEKVVYGFKHQLTLVRKGDNDAILKTGTVAAGPNNKPPAIAEPDDGKIVSTKLSWYMPHVLPNDQEKLALYKTVESKSSLSVDYRMIQCDSISVSQTRNFTWRLSVKSAPEKPCWIIVAFRTDKSGNQQRNPSIFDHCNLTNMFVMLNSRRHPETDYHDMNFTQQKFQGFMEMPRHSEQSFAMLKS